MKLEKYMDYQRLLDTICTLRQRLAVLLLWDIVVVQLLKSFKIAAEKLPEDMILTGQVYLLMRYHKGIKPFGYFLSVWVLCGLAAQYESFILPLSVILSLPAGIWCFPFAEVDRFRKYLCSGRHGNVDRIVR
jgi:hypothetical protein